MVAEWLRALLGCRATVIERHGPAEQMFTREAKRATIAGMSWQDDAWKQAGVGVRSVTRMASILRARASAITFLRSGRSFVAPAAVSRAVDI
jgi:hypothetical protein